MIVSMQKAVDSAIAYLSQEASKITSVQDKFIMYAALGAAKANSGSLIAPYMDRLRMVGIVNADGFVDTSVIRSAMDCAFSNVGSVGALGFTFNQADADSVLALMEA